MPDTLDRLHCFECCDEAFAFDPDTLRVFALDRVAFRHLRALTRACPPGTHTSPAERALRQYYASRFRPHPTPQPDRVAIPIPNSIARPTPPPRRSFSLCLILTHTCNLQCEYCYDRASRLHHGPAHLELDRIQSVIQQLQRDYDEIVVWFFGGEPLLRRDTLRAVVEWCVSDAVSRTPTRFHFTLTTNGLLLTDAVLEFLRIHRFSLLLSMDGPSEMAALQRSPTNPSAYAHRMSETLDRALVAYHDRPDQLAVRATLTRQLLPELTSLFTAFRARGVPRIYLAPATHDEQPMPADEADEWCTQLTALARHIVTRRARSDLEAYPHLASLVHAIESRSPSPGTTQCRMGQSAAALDVDGTLYPCHRFASAGRHRTPPTPSITLPTAPISAATPPPAPPCDHCWARLVCGNGICQYINWAWTGSCTTPPEALCRIQRRMIELACWISIHNQPTHTGPCTPTPG